MNSDQVIYPSVISKVLWGLLFLAIGISVFFCFYKLDQIPPGFTHDEIRHALDALDVLEGHYHLISTRMKQQNMSYNYFTAGVYSLFGVSRYVQRALTATFGVIFIATLFWTGRILFAPDLPVAKVGLLAVFSSLLAASSLWVIFISRIGLEYIMPPVCTLLGISALVIGYRRQQLRYVIGAALLSESSFYIYDGSAFILILLPGSLIIYEIQNGALRTGNLNYLKIPIVYTVIVTIFVLPIILRLFSGENPEVEYTTSQLIVNNASTLTGMLFLLGQSIWAHLETFLGISGDPNWFANFAGDPILSPLLPISFLIGLVICLYRHRQFPYLFLLLYLGLMMTPPILTFGNAIRHSRMSGAIPPTYFIIALAWVEGFDWLYTRLSKYKRQTALFAALAPFLIVALLWFPLTSYQRYFIDWAQHPIINANTKLFGQPSFQLIERMSKENKPSSIFLLAKDTHHPNRIIDYFYRGISPFRYVYLNDVTATQRLLSELKDYETVHVITELNALKELKQGNADATPILFVLDKYGDVVNTETLYRWKWTAENEPYQTEQVDYTITTYRLDPARPITVNFRDADLNLGEEVLLKGYYLDSDQQALSLALFWQPRQVITQDYKISVQLFDDTNQKTAQVDTTPPIPFSTLSLEDTMVSYHNLPLSNLTSLKSAQILVSLYFFQEKQLILVGTVVLNPAQ